MADELIDQLLGAFSEDRPVVLFLGQDYARPTGEVDPVLARFKERLAVPESIMGWRDVFSNRPLTVDDYQWLTERFERTVESEALERVFDLSWSSVFTTSLNPKVMRQLESRGRMPEAVLAKDHYARASRSKSRPAVHYLFGRSNETEPQYRAPRNGLEVARRLTLDAAPIAARIPPTATALGVVVIDGYSPASDWLTPESLLAPLSEKPGPAVFWFGYSEEIVDRSGFVQSMISEGLLKTDPRRLSEVLAERSSAVDSSQAIYQADSNTVSLPDGKHLSLTPALRLRTEAVAAVVDDTWTEPTSPLPTDGSMEDAFRRFHGDFGGPRTLVEGIAKGFAIERDFERSLLQAALQELRRSGQNEGYVVVHGQSGSGKSIALARLARELRIQSKTPVLMAWGRVPGAIEIDDFCKEAELVEAGGTVVLCDAGASYTRYRDLANGMRSRGRKAIVVGTSYKIEDSKLSKSARFVLAPETLSTREMQRLKLLLQKYGNADVAALNERAQGEHFLALLYRYLSFSRSRLAGGMSTEARSAEGAIRLRAQSLPRPISQRTALAQKLIEVGLGSGTTKIFEDEENGKNVGSDSAAKLVNYVMVSGRLDCPVPINLLLRALKSKDDSFDVTQIAYLFGELDLFRWKYADPEHNTLLVAPRLQLEAELICRRRMGDLRQELEAVIELIQSVRDGGIDGRTEVQFVLELLHKLHRDGPRKKAYSSGYLDIARALTLLRERHQVIDARLMLQESAFRREAIFAADSPDQPNGFPEELRESVLNEAREVIELALRNIESGALFASRRTKRNFGVERASVYGYLAVGLATRGAPEDTVWSQYLATRTAVMSAMAAVDNYFPLDIGLWAPELIAKRAGDNLSNEHKVELHADLLSMMDLGKSEKLPPDVAERFRERQIRIAPVLGDLKLKEEAYAALEVLNAPAAYFLRAREMCASLFESRQLISPELREQCRRSAEYLESKFDAIRGDQRCLLLLLQLRWVVSTGEFIFNRERCLMPTDPSVQSQVLQTTSLLNTLAAEGARNLYRLLEASLEWVTGDILHARELFRDLAKDSEFEDSSRVVRRLLLESGTVSGFRGRIEKARSDGHWEATVEGFSGRVDALSRDFPNEDFRPGRQFEGFNIAFNHLGPIADPRIRAGGRA